jgi:hypothetical protein
LVIRLKEGIDLGVAHFVFGLDGVEMLDKIVGSLAQKDDYGTEGFSGGKLVQFNGPTKKGVVGHQIPTASRESSHTVKDMRKAALWNTIS